MKLLLWAVVGCLLSEAFSPIAEETTHSWGGGFGDRASIMTGVTKGGPERQFPESTPPLLSCPEGFDKQGRACVKVSFTTISPFCPEGFSFELTTQECTLRKRKSAHVACPEGSSLKQGHCEIVETAAPIVTCDPTLTGDWVYDQRIGQCVRQSSFQPKMVCPDGYKVNKGNTCASTRKITPDLKCPHNFELAGKRCETWVYEQPVPECPPGYVYLDDLCVKELKQQPQLICPHGSRSTSGMHQGLDDTQCYTESILKPIHRCPDEGSGSAAVKGRLCDFALKQEPRLTCPPNFEREGEVCVQKHIHALIPVCDAGFRLDAEGKVCIKNYTQKADVVCPEGTLTKNGQCVVISTHPADVSCAKGFQLQGGVCVQHTSRQPTPKCPKGYRPTYRNECEMVVTVTPEMACPEGATPRAGFCELVDVQAYVAVCADGKPPGADGRCGRVDTKPPKHDCPSGFLYNKYLEECQKLGTVPPVYYCDEGQVVADECETTATVPALGECPKSYIAVEGQCERTEILEARLECPRKYKLKNGTCVKI